MEDVLTPAQRKVAYVIWKWLSFAVGLTTTIVGALNADDAKVLLALATANAVTLFIGSAIGKQAEDNTNREPV